MRKPKLIITLVIIFSISFSLFFSGKQFLTTLPSSMVPGSSGNEVEQLQQKLKNWGYYMGEINGSYGLKTLMAIKDFQKSHGLFQSGIADKNTLTAMGLTRAVETGTAYAEGGGIGNEQLLARAINGEARGEPYLGQVAVGAVILNRTRDSRFPKTIAGVIYQPGAFTAVSDGQINQPMESNSTVVKAARDALNGFDPTNGCVYYWNPATATSKWIWSRQVVSKIGKHYFAK